ncbi:MAG: TerC family protein [Phycisphaeraceae bacterium]|nr:TerC family protein [Phycisphaeraceae bacterium]
MIWLYTGFLVFVLIMLALDLFVVNRKPHAISVKAAVFWTGVCVVLALAFSLVVFQMYEHNSLGIGDAARERNSHQITSRAGLPDLAIGEPVPELPAPAADASTRDIEERARSWTRAQEALTAPDRKVAWQATLEFLSGWLIEYSLSLDNIFVIALIFTHFAIPKIYQHRVLFWGILGALIMRGIMIALGAVLIAQFQWILYVFGVFLIFTAFKLLRNDDNAPKPEQGMIYRLARKLFPFHDEIAGQKFFIRKDGRLWMTPLFLVLLIVEGTDVVFAVDSIPAIFAITQDPFLVFTSNVFAILGLRSLYFALAAMMDKFRFIKVSLAVVLAFIGVKMILLYWHIHLPTAASLGVIVVVLATGVLASLFIPARAAQEERPTTAA